MNIAEKLFPYFQVIFEKGYFGISIFDITASTLLLFFALLIRSIFAKLIVNKLKIIVTKTNNKFDDKVFDVLLAPLKLLPMVIVFLILSLNLDIQSNLGIYIKKLNHTLITIFIFWLIHQMISFFSFYISKLEKLLTKGLSNWVIKSTEYLIVFLGIVAVLELWGIKIGPVIAGLGLFGVAVALGAQDLFKNLISGIMILLEKRFNIGDVICLPNHTEGTVEHIGFRSTLIRKFDSTPITVPNYIFAEMPILNFSNRFNRRINWIIGLEYNSTIDQIKKLTDHISNYINSSEDFIVNDLYKSFIRLDKFNDSSIDILIYCFTSTNDWEKYLIIKEKLAIEIKQKIEQLNLNFAFPSQSIYIEKN
jgi:MscS family membrane protein